MANFSLALGCQISEANKSNRGKVIAEGVIGAYATSHTRQRRPGSQNGRVGTIVSPELMKICLKSESFCSKTKNFLKKHLTK
ncbi:MAG: hypothetical protein IKT08_09425, partial [Bacteroidales bacterium]|nr:hypothetical protein [Bacteroidales bacterium]